MFEYVETKRAIEMAARDVCRKCKNFSLQVPFGCKDKKTCIHVKHFVVALAIVDKQVPKTPLEVKGDTGEFFYICPRCKNGSIDVWVHGEKVPTKYEYCPDCGQHLDWSDYDDRLE